MRKEDGRESYSVALLGTGLMGSAIAVNLAKAGFSVKAWNRTSAKARALAKNGVIPCKDQAQALDGSSVLITMLSDGPAVIEAVAGHLRPGLLWAQMSTVGEADTEHLTRLAADAGVRLVDAPVLGTVAPALRGELIVLVGGEAEDVRALGPIYEVLAKRVVNAGGVGDATRLKLTLNLWSLLTVTAMAEVLAFAERCSVDPRVFLETIEGGASDSVYARSKANMMLDRQYDPSARLELVCKDLRLAVDGAKARGLELKLAAGAVALMGRAIAEGYGGADAAAVVEALRGT